jgi:hypothetical protein
MFRIDDATAATTLPTPESAGTEGYFTEGTPGVTPATLVRASWLNSIQEELRAIVVAGGLTPSKTTRNQVLSAIEYLIDAQSGNYALDTGTANAKAVAVDPAITSYPDGYTVRFKNLILNTDACTLSLSGLSAIALCNDVGSDLIAGDLPTGVIVTAVYDATSNKFFITSLVASQALTQSAADVRYAALAGLASQVFSVATATAAAHAVRYDQSLGMGQSWQVVTGSRAYNTTYTNTTGRPILVSASSTNAVNTDFVVGGVIATTTGPFNTSQVVLVPAGATYSLNGGATLYRWSEFR